MIGGANQAAFAQWPRQAVTWDEELRVTECFERTNADDCLFAGSLGGVDLPVKVVIAELAGRGLDLVPVRAQSNELERIIQQPFERLARVQAHGIGLSRTKADAEECRVARLDGQLFPALGERLE